MVNSDNVVKCYEAFTEYPFMYVAVEYMDGHDMSYRIEVILGFRTFTKSLF